MAGNGGRGGPRVVARLGTAAVLGCFGAWELTDPGQWTGYVPHALAAIAPPVPLVLLHGWALFVLAAAALVDLAPRAVSWLAVAMMAEVVCGLLLTSGATSILVRDLGILALALVWALDSRAPASARGGGSGAAQRPPAAAR